MSSRRIALLLSAVSMVVLAVWILYSPSRDQNSAADAVQDGLADGDASASSLEPWRSPDDPLPSPATEEALLSWLDRRAASMAASAYQPPDESLPPALRSLDYDAYNQIRYRPEAAIWQGRTPFELQLFHRGGTQEDRVALYLVEGDSVRRVAFEPRRFRYERQAAPLEEDAADWAGLDHAGFRVHYPLNRAGVADEVVVFLGASYFRLLGPGQAHGLSSRGLAVNVLQGEEFPDFRAFWLARPEPGDSTLTILALLDGPSVAGAYRFELLPGQAGRPGREATIVDVEARLHARRDIDKLGVAPLTSMYLFGPREAARFDDFRARVHDSEALLIHDGRDEWTWRPLTNDGPPEATLLPDSMVRGYGLVQRHRDFGDYLDAEARYHLRPSQWVEPAGWGAGAVELVELPSDSEFFDNVVASWVPAEELQAGASRTYRYRLHTFDDALAVGEPLRVRRWRSGWDALPGASDPPPRSRRRFVVDFAPAPGGGEESAGTRPDLSLTTSTGDVSDAVIVPLPGGGWRVSFRMEAPGVAWDRGDPAVLRLFLARNGSPVSEIWRYPWRPGPDA